ncbi:MAG TPA: right-handed parallel beta-helix repeat-containing protein [Candidatus Hydrogenedentes bacterium]|nr:right-handed parallel beta-helix repeat-containing protein [Candidatus Hydrogenedentota bacterium]HOH49586.1 right-handed parallel beta-helix repeat-containing protein [Candidatus Hydrogenedentota bacterium]
MSFRTLLFPALACLLFSLAGAAQDAAPSLAELADGTRSAAAALQRMIEESDGLVDLPAGTFLLDAPLVLDLPRLGWRSLRGADGATRLVVAHAGPGILVQGDHQGTANPATVQDHTWEKERFPSVSGVEILGAHPEADGIVLSRTMKCVIRGVLVRKCRHGIRLVERNRNTLIADAHIYDCLDTGVLLDACDLHQVNLTGSHISYNGRAGVRQFNGDVHNVQISGNDIEYNAGAEGGLPAGEIVLEAPEGIISEYSITGNTLQARPQNPGANLLVLGAENNTPHAARTMTVSGNVIGDRDKNIVLSRACRVTVTGNTVYGGAALNIHLDRCANIVLSGNNIGSRPFSHAEADPHVDGVLVEECDSVLLSGNILSGHRFGTPERGGAVTLVNARTCRVTGCQILHPRVRGVHLLGGAGCVVSDNTITAPDGGEDFLAAVELSGDGKNHLVQNNALSDAPDPVLLADPAQGTVKDNTLLPAP